VAVANPYGVFEKIGLNIDRDTVDEDDAGRLRKELNADAQRRYGASLRKLVKSESKFHTLLCRRPWLTVPQSRKFPSTPGTLAVCTPRTTLAFKTSLAFILNMLGMFLYANIRSLP
jgi:hypothetical protein